MPETAPAPAKKPKTLTAAVIAAYMAGFGTAGSGVVPPIVVEGNEPADKEGWTCETTGPVLNAKINCRFTGVPAAPPVDPNEPCGWYSIDRNGEEYRVWGRNCPDAGTPDVDGGTP